MDINLAPEPLGLHRPQDRVGPISIGKMVHLGFLNRQTLHLQDQRLQHRGEIINSRLHSHDPWASRMIKNILQLLAMMILKDLLAPRWALVKCGALSITHMDPRWARRLVRQLLEQLLE